MGTCYCNRSGDMEINLDSQEILSAKEAAKIWHKNTDYVRTSIHKSPEKWPKGSWRKFGKQIIVTAYGMEQVTGKKDPRKQGKSNAK